MKDSESKLDEGNIPNIQIIQQQIVDTMGKIERAESKLESAENKLKLAESQLELLAESVETEVKCAATQNVRELRALVTNQTNLLSQLTALLVEHRHEKNMLLASQGKINVI